MKNILSGSFLRDFYYTNEPFGVLDGRLYTINKANNTNTKNFLSINNEFYIINESEEIEILEKKLFLQRKGEIESAVSAYIDSNIGKIKEGISNFNELNNYYKSFENNSVEKFLMVDVIDAYNHSDKNVSININLDDFNEHQMPSIEDLIPKKNFLGTITKDFLVFEHNVYLLEKIDSIMKNFVILNNKQYAINQNMLLKELCEKYETRLTKNIYDNLDKNKKELSSALEILSNQKKELDKRIKLEKNYSSRANKGYGNIRVEKKGSNHYNLILTVPPYIIEKN
ncbi:MAG: hypothetical protein AABW92_04635, partial [Nanoarchaeota archaeon]